jgi:hypothetical protein
MNETKFIITKDRKHFKSNFNDHYIIGSLNNYLVKDIIETGLIIDHKIIILECYHKKHLDKIRYSKFILQDVMDYTRILLARRLGSQYSYGIIKEGD